MLPEAVALCVDLQDVDIVCDAVEQRTDEAFAGEHRVPLLEGHVSELVDQKADHGEPILKAGQSPIVLRFVQFMDQVGDGGGAHGESLSNPDGVRLDGKTGSTTIGGADR